MVRLTKGFIRDNIAQIVHPSTGRFLKKHVLENITVPTGGFESDLSGSVQEEIEYVRGSSINNPVVKFKIIIPGYGWCNAKIYGSMLPKSMRNVALGKRSSD